MGKGVSLIESASFERVTVTELDRCLRLRLDEELDDEEELEEDDGSSPPPGGSGGF